MKTIILNVLLAVTLFFLNGLLGRFQYGYSGNLFKYGRFCFSMDDSENFSGNFFLKVVNPTIYTALSCAVFQYVGLEEICRSLWLITPVYWGIRLLFILLRNFFEILNWKYEICAAIVSLVLCEGVFFFFIIPLINADMTVFIPVEETRNAVWFAIMAYVVKVIWEISRTVLSGQSIYPIEKQSAVIQNRYNKFSQKYGAYILELVDASYPSYVEMLRGKGNFLCLVYAIMILEDFNRPRVYRFLEYILKRLLPNTYMTLGIMQVKTKYTISDRDSIRIAISKLLSVYVDSFHNDPIHHAIWDYNNSLSYLNDAEAIYRELLELNSIDDLIPNNEPYMI